MSLAKPRPRMLDKADQRKQIAKTDREENAKVKARSGGQCEVVVVTPAIYWPTVDGRSREVLEARNWHCPLRASHVHHLISGIGRRNVGQSIEAAHKLHVCERCHAEIHGHVLKPINATERESAATVRYERVR